MVKPLKRETLKLQITGHLLEAIAQKELLPGERIIEGKLAQTLHVSKVTLREALQELEYQGLVTKLGNHGTYVTKLSLEDIEDIYEVRLQLEPKAAILAHKNLTPEHCAELGRLLETMRYAGIQRNYAEAVKTDMAFHRLVWKIAGRRALERALTVASAPFFGFLMSRRYARLDSEYEKHCENHLALLTALKEGGPEEVGKAFAEHLESSRLDHLDFLRKSQVEQSVVNK